MSVYLNIAWHDGSLGTIWGPCLDGSKDPCECKACKNANRVEAEGLDFSAEYEKAKRCPFKCLEEDFDRVCAAMSAQAELDALIEAARSVAAWHKGEGVIMRSELDALAALVGEG